MKITFKRFLAYLIDTFLITSIVYMLTNTGLNPNLNQIKKYNNDIEKITLKYNDILKEVDEIFKLKGKDLKSYDLNKIDNLNYIKSIKGYIKDEEITKEEKQEFMSVINSDYQNETKDTIYKLKKLSYFQSILLIFISFLYFVVFQYIMNGETLGRKLTKTLLTNNNGDKLTIISLVIRWIILYGIYEIVIDLIILFTLDKNSYLNTVNLLSNISYFIQMLIIFTTLIKVDNRGLHDMISNTKVIEVKKSKSK